MRDRFKDRSRALPDCWVTTAARPRTSSSGSCDGTAGPPFIEQPKLGNNFLRGALVSSKASKDCLTVSWGSVRLLDACDKADWFSWNIRSFTKEGPTWKLRARKIL